MGIKAWIARKWAKRKAKEYQRIHQHPLQVQRKVFDHLLQTAAETEFGKAHGFSAIKSPEDFRKAVPAGDYEFRKTYFESIRKGNPDVTWPGRPRYLAKTSGTVSGAKYIPITRESIRYQINAARDLLLMYIYHTGNAGFLNGKMMFLSGSPVIDSNEYGMKTGRLSGIVNHFVPAYLQRNRIPSFEANSIEDWDMKVKKILDEARREDLRLISGIPPWVQMFFEMLEEKEGRLPLEQWPNLGVFVQGGVDFSPYRPVFRHFFQNKVDILETYPASEGFFAFQDDVRQEGLLLNIDAGIWFEFIPMEEYGKPDAPRLTLGEVELDRQYALVISTNAGLWAYDIGDTIRFVSLNPHRIRVTGRVKHFISAFGEHVISEEVNQAMLHACAETDAEVQEFHVAPLVSEIESHSHHEWLAEFTKMPSSADAFVSEVDRKMRELNSYYDDLRKGNLLAAPVVKRLELNASRAYMKSVGKLGGQNKFPRLSNDRKIADFLQQFVVDSPFNG